MSKFKWIALLAVVLSAVAFLACDPGGGGGDYEYYSLNGTGAVRSCRVYYPSALENSNKTYPAVTLSGGMTNTKEAMYWMAEYLARQGVVVFTISAANNMTVNGYESAHRNGYQMMVAENGNQRSPLHQKIKNYGLMGYSMGGGAVINVGEELGDKVAAVVAMAPFGPQSNLRDTSAGVLIMVGRNDSVASAGFNAEPAYRNLPDTIDKCLLEFRSFSHLQWVSNNGSSGNAPKQLAGDWVDFVMNGNVAKRRSFTNPPAEVAQNMNNL